MTKPNLNQTIAQVVAENPPPKCLESLGIADINKIVSLCEEFKFIKLNRSEFARKFEAELSRILQR